MTITTVKTGISRTITVTKHPVDAFIKVHNDYYSRHEQALLTAKQADKIALALLTLPKVKEDGNGYIEAGSCFRYIETNDSATLLKSAKELFAIGLELQKREEAAKIKAAEEAAAKEVELEAKRHAEAELNSIRDAILAEHRWALGFSYTPAYLALSHDKRKLVDALVQAKQLSV